MTEEQDAWFAQLEEQLSEKTVGAGYNLVARLFDFGAADKMIPVDVVMPVIVVPVQRDGRTIATKRYRHRGTGTTAHWYPEQWWRLFGTEPLLCGVGMVDVSIVDYELTGGSL